MANNTIAIVTGANRGIGLGICKTLISTPKYQPLTLYACSRRGLDLALTPSNPNTVIKYAKLDISSQESISNFAEEVRSELKSVKNGEGRVILINNAATVLTPHNAENVKAELDVNFRGTLNMCLAFIPLLGPQGRIVNLSATLLPYDPPIQTRFSGPDVTLASLEELAREYEKAVSTNTESQSGFGSRHKAYFIGKYCVNALTAILARENEGLVINACCPGWVDTEIGNMGAGKPPKTIEEGARIPIRLGFGDLKGVTGNFWANESIVGTGDGEVREW